MGSSLRETRHSRNVNRSPLLLHQFCEQPFTEAAELWERSIIREAVRRVFSRPTSAACRFVGTQRGFGDNKPTWRVLAYREGKEVAVADQGTRDEIVVDDWLHVERMDVNVWWLRIGDARLFVTVSGIEPPIVDIERGCYAAAKGTTLVRDEWSVSEVRIVSTLALLRSLSRSRRSFASPRRGRVGVGESRIRHRWWFPLSRELRRVTRRTSRQSPSGAPPHPPPQAQGDRIWRCSI